MSRLTDAEDGIEGEPLHPVRDEGETGDPFLVKARFCGELKTTAQC